MKNARKILEYERQIADCEARLKTAHRGTYYRQSLEVIIKSTKLLLKILMKETL